MILSTQKSHVFYWLGAFVMLLFSSFAIVFDQIFLLVVPIVALCGVLILLYPRLLYLALFSLLPFSVEVNLPGGFGTDLPTEPIMILCSGLFLLLLCNKEHKLDWRQYISPISFILFASLIWMLFTSLFSSEFLISLKYSLAKVWYVIPFFLLTIGFYWNKLLAVKTLLRLFFGSLFLALLYVNAKHATLGFSFDTINKACQPIFRNHVNYGAMLVLSLPYLGYLLFTSTSRLHKLIYSALGLFILVSIYFTYTRAAYVCVPCIVGAYVIFRWKLVKPTLIAVLVVASIGVGYLIQKNTYLDYAPNYERTIAHYNFDNLMEATYKFEDVSTMERVYRWVAGFRMIGEKPILGFGPGAFYESYRPYTLTSFQTYVSDNPEHSGIHNYYLMLAVEQGIPGLVLLLLITILPLTLTQQLYFSDLPKDYKYLGLAAALSLIVIALLQLMNDLVESDKIGSFYFFSLAIISILWSKSNLSNGLPLSDTDK